MSRRSIQVGLGVLWLIDGLLKFQPALWRAGFVKSVIEPNAQGQPSTLAWTISHMATLLAHGQSAWVALFGIIEIGIGLGLLFRRTVKAALVLSFVWAPAVWLFGEGVGGVLTGQASPLMGAPGASYLYALVGALVWPTNADADERRTSGLASSAIGSGRFGVAGGVTVWGLLWFMQAALWLLPSNRASGAIASQLSSMAAGEPGWYAHFLHMVGGLFSGSGDSVAWCMAAVSLVVALGPAFSRRAGLFIALGLAVGLVYWVSGEAFGQLMTFSGTDPNNAPAVFLLGLGLLPTVAAEASAPVLAASLFRRHRVASSVASSVGLLVMASVAALPGTAAASVPSVRPPSTGQQEKGMTPGLPLVQPASLNTATPPVLRLRLVAEKTEFDISGKKVWGESYDGDYIGPTMHFVPGEHVILTLVNQLATPTNLHFHGMHLSPSGDADNPFITVLPGHSFTYRFTVPMDQPLGTFWYHDHEMCVGGEAMAMPGMTPPPSKDPDCADSESQIYDGLSGTIVVGDDRMLLPEDLRHITAETLALKDMQITADHHIVQNSSTYAIDSGAPTVRLVNGQLRPVLTMRPGQTELWRFANEGADIFYDLRLPGYRFTVVGQDGYPVAKVTTVSTLDLPPAKRWDVLVTASSHPGDSWLRTLSIDNGPQGDTYPQVNLMELEVAGPPERPLPMPIGAIPTAPASLAEAHVARHRTLVLSENEAGTEMYINGRQFDPNKSVFSTPAVLGTVEQWTIYNATGEIHPFHVHTDHFQVMSINGVPQPYTGEQDIVPVPYEQHGRPGIVVIRIQFTDWTGRIMFHCHIAAHEDAGMMSFVDVVAPRS